MQRALPVCMLCPIAERLNAAGEAEIQFLTQ